MITDTLRLAVIIMLIALIVFGVGTAITGNPLPILAGVIVGMVMIALALGIAKMVQEIDPQ